MASKQKPSKKKVVKNVAKSSGKRSNSSPTKRALYEGRIPRPELKISGSNDHWRVSGYEVVDKIRCSQKFLKESFDLNPLENRLFPRLAGIALQFQRYRFRKVRVHYDTACPATRSGSFGMGISESYLPHGKIPSDFISMGAFNHSALGSVASNFSTPEWSPAGSEKFILPDGTLGTSNLVDVYKVYQGTLMFLSGDADSTDDDKSAGYVTIEYDCDLEGFRGTIDKLLSIQNEYPTTFVGSASSSTLRSNLRLQGPDGLTDKRSIGQLVGTWGIEPETELFPTLADREATYITGLEAGDDLLLKYSIPLSAESAASMDGWFDEDTPRDLRRASRVPSISINVKDIPPPTFDPRYVSGQDGWVPEEFPPTRFDDEKRVLRALPTNPGEVIVQIAAITAAGLVYVLSSLPFAADVAARLVTNSLAFTVPPDAIGLVLDVFLPSGKQRALQVDGSTVPTTGFTGVLPTVTLAKMARRVA